VLREQVAHLGFGRRERQVSNVNLHVSNSRLFSQTRPYAAPSRGSAGHSQRQETRSG
jgi:hypothetical protein